MVNMWCVEHGRAPAVIPDICHRESILIVGEICPPTKMAMTTAVLSAQASFLMVSESIRHLMSKFFHLMFLNCHELVPRSVNLA
jgi:hypothetical protein